MKVYAVGGAVRDELLGRPVSDRDYVVVGATPDEMEKLGYRAVGKDFPVFLHPVTHEEYALARTERKVGRGYKGFAFHTSREVTLEQDLARRDLTINAIARDEHGALIDPFGGERDLRAGVLRHVGEAFLEDPVRILRVARFVARFGFHIAPETLALMRRMVEDGEADHLVPERVWQELAKGLMEAHPERMFAALADCGLLARLFPAEHFTYAGGEPADAVTRAFVGALRHAAQHGMALPVRFALLAGPLLPDPLMQSAGRPGASAQERAALLAATGKGDTALEQLATRLRAPNDCRDAARLFLRAGNDMIHVPALDADAVLSLVERCDAFRRPEQLDGLVLAAQAWRVGVLALPVGMQDTVDAELPGAGMLIAALAAARGVDAAAIARAHPGEVAVRLREARVRAIAAAGIGATGAAGAQ